MAVAGGLVLGCGERPGEREFENAIQQFERENLVRAKDLFEKSINKRPGHEENAVAYQYLGVIAWQLDEVTEAVAYFERSRRRNPALFEPVYSLGAIAFEEGDFLRARTLFSAAAELKPNDPRPLEYLARTYRGEVGHRDARRTLTEARARAPQSPRVLTALAVIDWKDGEASSAVSLLMQALEHDPNYPPAIFNLGRIYADWPGQEAHAIEYFNQYLAVAPDTEHRARARNMLARLKSEPEDAAQTEREPATDEPSAPRPYSLDDLLADAQALADDGQVDQAVALCLRAAVQARQHRRIDQEERALQMAVELGPEDGRAHVALGRFMAERERHADALSAYRRAVRLEPEWAHALVGLAESAMALSDYDVALDALNRAVALAPEEPDPLWSLATLYDETGVRGRAVESYRRFRERFGNDPRATRAADRMASLKPPAPADRPNAPAGGPTGPSARNVQAAADAFQRGVSYQQRQEMDNALFFYHRAIQLDPSLERAHYNRGLILLERRNLREARDAFARSVELRPNKASARYNLALVYYELNEPASALPHLNAAVREDPNFAPAHLLLGIIHAADPDTRARAHRHYERFLDLRPDDPSSATVREWLARN